MVGSAPLPPAWPLRANPPKILDPTNVGTSTGQLFTPAAPLQATAPSDSSVSSRIRSVTDASIARPLASGRGDSSIISKDEPSPKQKSYKSSTSSVASPPPLGTTSPRPTSTPPTLTFLQHPLSSTTSVTTSSSPPNVSDTRSLSAVAKEMQFMACTTLPEYAAPSFSSEPFDFANGSPRVSRLLEPAASPKVQRRASFSKTLVVTSRMSGDAIAGESVAQNVEDGRTPASDETRGWQRESRLPTRASHILQSDATPHKPSNHEKTSLLALKLERRGSYFESKRRKMQTFSSKHGLSDLASNASPRSSFRSSRVSLNSEAGGMWNLPLLLVERIWILKKLIGSESSVRLQVLTCFLALQLTLFVIAISVRLAVGARLPGIRWYNFSHSFLGLMGKNLFLVGVIFSQLCAKATTASLLAFSAKGASITDVTFIYGKHNPKRGRKLRWLSVIALTFVEGALWLLEYELEWKTTIALLGDFPCTPADYPNSPSDYTKLQTYLEGEVVNANIYNFALPLGDGLVGGWAAWPTFVPARTFAVTGKGYAFLVSAKCSTPTPSEFSTLGGTLAPEDLGSTRFELPEEQFWNNTYIATVLIDMPATSHQMPFLRGRRAQQLCEISITVGFAEVAVAFKADEWMKITGSQISQIVLNETQAPLMPRMPREVFAAEVESLLLNGLEVTRKMHPERVQVCEQIMWAIAVGVNTVFRDTKCNPRFRHATTCSILQWAVDPVSQLYTDENMFRGVSGVVAGIAHYILMQYDGSTVGLCPYYGQDGSGYISASSWIVNLVIAMLVFCSATELALLFLVLWTSEGGSQAADCAARILEDPLRLLYDVRLSLPKLVSKVKGPDTGNRALRRHLLDVAVRYGESRVSRSDEIGSLVLDDPKRTLKLRRNRSYV
ncbi:hypothetical protein DFJ73DRAFT_33787 [Zopfochytrium polystomum]|nr:hypothetical protein DFJ73DRAFT_33787 [Zopfochytrium polystomum]